MHDFKPLSDHCATSCTLLTSFFDNTNTQQAYLEPLPGKFLWDSEASNRYSTLIQNIKSKTKLQQFLSRKYSNCNEAVNNLNTILQETAMASAKFIKRRIKNKQIDQKENPGFQSHVMTYIKLLSTMHFL